MLGDLRLACGTVSDASRTLWLTRPVVHVTTQPEAPHTPMAIATVLTVVLLLLVLANALFVAVEFAFLTVDRHTVRQQAESGDKTAKLADTSLRRTSTNLSGAQLGITLSSLIAGFLTGPSVGVLLEEGLGWAGLPAAAAVGIGATAAFVLVTFTQMVFGELVPKNWAIADPLRVTRLVAMPQKVFMVLFGWLVAILNGAANWVLRKLGLEPAEEVADARTAEELLAVARRSGTEGTLEQSTAELVGRSIQFGELTAADVMRPRPRVTFVEGDEPVQSVIDTAVRTGHSRFPVTGEGVDDVLGLVHYKHALAVPAAERASRTVREVTKDAAVVVESMTLDPLLRELRQPGLQMALVVDEYGGTAGVVTLEDLVEEIVGEIEDEQDIPEHHFERIDEHSVRVSGLLRPDELGRIVALRMPEGEETDTLGGLLAEHLDRMPEVGDVAVFDALDTQHRDEDNLPTTAQVTLTVESIDGHRVDAIRAERTVPPEGASTDDDEKEAGR